MKGKELDPWKEKRHFNDKRQQWLNLYIWRMFVISSWVPLIKEGFLARAGYNQNWGIDAFCSRGQWGPDTPDTRNSCSRTEARIDWASGDAPCRKQAIVNEVGLNMTFLDLPASPASFLSTACPESSFQQLWAIFSSPTCSHWCCPLSVQGCCLGDFCLSFKTQLKHCCVLWEASPDLPLPPRACEMPHLYFQKTLWMFLVLILLHGLRIKVHLLTDQELFKSRNYITFIFYLQLLLYSSWINEWLYHRSE